MSDTVIMPQLGETVAEGKILTWFKSVGDEIKEGDNLFEVETDKVTIDVQAIVSGRLMDIKVGAGEVAKVGAVVAVIGGDALAERPSEPDRGQGEPEPAAMQKAAPWRSPFEEVSTPVERFGPAEGPDGMRVTPLARRLIAQNGLDLGGLAAEVGRRGGNRIDERAVRLAIAGAHPPAMPAALVSKPAAPPTATAPLAPLRAETITLNAVRLKTGDRLAENWRTIPHVFQAIEVDFTALDRVRAKHKPKFQERNGFSLTYLPFIARAACLSIQAFPQINARFDGKALSLSPTVNLGVAVDLSHNGLVVPVVRGAEDLTLLGLAKAMRRLIEKARAGSLGPDDLSGGTYSISNNGAFGTTFTAPIINAPQVAILSTDAIQLKPAVVTTPEGAFVAPRMIGVVGQSFDHRAFDGLFGRVSVPTETGP